MQVMTQRLHSNSVNKTIFLLASGSMYPPRGADDGGHLLRFFNGCPVKAEKQRPITKLQGTEAREIHGCACVGQ